MISGVGWLIDFSVFFFISVMIGKGVGYANIISAMPAVTFVFIVSTRRTFKNIHSKVDLKYKYLVYIAYQVILVLGMSWFAQHIYDYFYTSNLMSLKIVNDNLKMFVKLLITPITMVVNFIVMKNLIEKI